MTKEDLLQTEQDHQKRAFEYYYALGEKRSYGRVAQEMDVSPSAVKLWSRSFGWRQRVQERDADVARKVADRAIQSNVDKLDRNQKIVQMALVKLAKGIADGKVRMQLGDLERLVRLQAFLDESGQQETGQKKYYYADHLYQSLIQADAETLRFGMQVFEALSRGWKFASSNRLPRAKMKGQNPTHNLSLSVPCLSPNLSLGTDFLRWSAFRLTDLWSNSYGKSGGSPNAKTVPTCPFL